MEEGRTLLDSRLGEAKSRDQYQKTSCLTDIAQLQNGYASFCIEDTEFANEVCLGCRKVAINDRVM